jgi:hypothetical protein
MKARCTTSGSDGRKRENRDVELGRVEKYRSETRSSGVPVVSRVRDRIAIAPLCLPLPDAGIGIG